MKLLKKARSVAYILGTLLLIVGILPLTAITNIGTVYAQKTCPDGQTPNADGICVCPDGTYAATDGTCKDVPPPVVPPDPKYGCTDPSAFNYNPTATIDDGSCVAVCPHNTGLAANNPACDPAPVYGCKDQSAFNYNMAATVDDGSCVAICASDSSLPANSPACVPVVSGCTTPGMFNFNPAANKDDGTCVAICQWNTALAATDTGCVAPADACGKDFPCMDPQAQAGWSDGVVVNENLTCVASDSKGVCTDARVKIDNTTYEAECGEPNKTINAGNHSVELFDPYDTVITDYYGGPSAIDLLMIAVNVATRDGWNDLFERNVYWYLLGKTPSMATDTLTTEQKTQADLIKSGANDVVLRNVGVYFLGVKDDLSFSKQLMFLKYCAPVVPGCTDPNALNYNPLANQEDNSCIKNIPGCTDPKALNYDPRANYNDGSCSNKVPGCTIEGSLNYDSNANYDDGSCIEKVPGCMDDSAVNYNEKANFDDGSCQVPDTLLGLDPFCVAGPGGFSLGWTVENPNNFDVPASWSLDGVGGSGTLAPGTNFIGTTDDGPATHTMSVSWVNGSASSSSSMVCSSTTTTTTTTTFTPTIPVTGGGAGGATESLIIPVTGVDLGEQLQTYAKYLGLLVIGMALILEGVLKKQKIS